MLFIGVVEYILVECYIKVIVKCEIIVIKKKIIKS